MVDMTYLTSEKIYEELQKMVSKDITLFDAIVEFCDKRGLEVELVGSILKKNQQVKQKIVSSASELNLLKK